MREGGHEPVAFGERGGAVDGSDVLGIAQRAIDRRGVDRDLRAGAFLPALAAAPTHGDRDLELRGPWARPPARSRALRRIAWR
jgi:hypothetical protein